jgi:hypothetical protein
LTIVINHVCISTDGAAYSLSCGVPFTSTNERISYMKMKLIALTGACVSALAIGGFALAETSHDGMMHANMAAPDAKMAVPADKALSGVPMVMTPGQLPAQFSTQVRGDTHATGIATLKRNGNDVEYTFELHNLSGPLTQAHFHNAPHEHVGQRHYSICGVVGESPACPVGADVTVSGVWKDADIASIERGDMTIAFHTALYPAPIGEVAVYIPAKQ